MHNSTAAQNNLGGSFPFRLLSRHKFALDFTDLLCYFVLGRICKAYVQWEREYSVFLYSYPAATEQNKNFVQCEGEKISF